MRPHPSDSKIRRQLHVRGTVQGVGFRLFVYKLATSLGLTGFVFNSSSGVTVEIEGDATVIRTFIDSLELDPPSLAEILELTVSEMTTVGSAGIDILQSREEVGEFALVSPDVGTCEACWRDFGDPITDVSAIRSQIGHTVVRATPSSRTSHMIARRRRCPASSCAEPASLSTAIRPRGASTLSRTPARSAVHRSALAPAARYRRTVRLPRRIRSRPSAWQGNSCEKAESSPSKV